MMPLHINLPTWKVAEKYGMHEYVVFYYLHKKSKQACDVKPAQKNKKPSS